MVACQSLLIASYLVGLSVGYHAITRTDLVREDGKEEPSELPLFSAEEEPNFLRPQHLAPGEISTAVRRDTKQTIDKGTFYIGLPPKLTQAFQDYVRDSGMLQVADELLYSKPVVPNENRLYTLSDGTMWGARTSNHWSSDGDMTWIDPANEWTYELILDIYRNAGFDHILDTIGEKYGSEGLWIDGTSLIIVSHFNGTNIHTDLEDMEGDIFNVLFPIVIPSSGGMLHLADRDTRQGLGTPFRYHQGVLVGGASPHGTGPIDYRATGEFRMAVAVYMDDLQPDTVAEFDDATAAFPPAGDLRYLMSQAGRHWTSDTFASLEQDKGRRPYRVRDQNPLDCPNLAAQEGKCNELSVRNMCVKSCHVYLENDVYYEKLGRLLGWPTETEREL